MPISTRFYTDMSVEEGLEHFADEITDMVYSLALDSAELVKPFLLDELRFYPPVPPNSKYVRTFRLKRGWKVELERRGRDRVAFAVSNDTPYTQWVVGSLAQDTARARSYQQDFHAAHGWPLATETVKFFFEAYQEDFDKRFDGELLARFTSTRFSQRAQTRLAR